MSRDDTYNREYARRHPHDRFGKGTPRPFSLRRSTYRGVDGWLITGGPGAFSVSIHFEHESAAGRTIGKLRADPRYVTTQEDFLP